MVQASGRREWGWLAWLEALGALACFAGAALAEDRLPALAARAAAGVAPRA